MNRADPGRPRGFTLVEVLATFTIIAIILPTVAQGLSVCMKSSSSARRQLQAATMADSKLQELIAWPGSGSQAVSGDFSPEFPEFRWSATSYTRADSLQEALLVVTWIEGNGEQSFALTALYYRGATQ